MKKHFQQFFQHSYSKVPEKNPLLSTVGTPVATGGNSG